MNVSEFKEILTDLRATNSRTEKKEIIRSAEDSPAAITFLSGEEFDDAGLGKKTVLSVAQDVFAKNVDGDPTVSESLVPYDGGHGANTLYSLRGDMEELSELSGNQMKNYLESMFEQYDYPSVVAHACLNDWPTGVSDTTIANALDIRESLPFYDSVVDIVEENGEPLTSPEVGRPFDPMLAVPESRGRPDSEDNRAQMKLDGYRCLIHVSNANRLEDDQKRVTAFSRRRNDITESLPELQEIDWPDGEYIFDTEVLAETGSYSDTSQRIGRDAENVDREIGMNFGVFDLIKSKSLSRAWELVYEDRYDQLKTIESNISDERFHVLGLESDIEFAKDEAAAHGSEGIIVKDMTASYEFGDRSSSWQKVKLDAKTVDCVVSGFHEGEGRLSGSLGKIDLETADGRSVGSCGTGFSDEERDEIWANQDQWLGRVVEIEARGLGTGGDSDQPKLRMPVFVRDRSDDGCADSWDRISELMKNI